MMHFDESLSTFLNYLQSELTESIQEVIILRDVRGFISANMLVNEACKIEAERIAQQIETKLGQDEELKIYCAHSPTLIHDTDDLNDADSLWSYLKSIAQPTSLTNDPRIKLVERLVEGETWLKATKSPFGKPPPFIITFYSFKGGVGRTTAAALTALKLARWGNRVCLLDFDLEAPGLSSLIPLAKQPKVGIVDYLLERRISGKEALPMADYLVRFEDEEMTEKEGELWLMPAGKVDQNYLLKLGRLDFQAMTEDFSESVILYLFQDLQKHKEFDYYILDARTGITDIGGLALSGLSHKNVLLFGLGEQNYQGMRFVLGHLQPMLAKENLTPAQVADRFLFVFSPVPWGRGQKEDQELKDDLGKVVSNAMMEEIYKPLFPQLEEYGEEEEFEELDMEENPYRSYSLLIPYLSDLPLKQSLQEIDYSQSQRSIPPYDQLAESILRLGLFMIFATKRFDSQVDKRPTTKEIWHIFKQGDPKRKLWVTLLPQPRPHLIGKKRHGEQVFDVKKSDAGFYKLISSLTQTLGDVRVVCPPYGDDDESLPLEEMIDAFIAPANYWEIWDE